MTTAEPPRPSGSRTLVVLYYGTAFLLIALIIGLSVAQAFGEPVPAENAPEVLTPVPEPVPVIRVENLTCFTCHSLETYHNGGDGAFPHDFHADMLEIEGCHACHAFTHHDPAPIRLDLCADCH